MSRLLSLPGELRNLIYDSVVEDMLGRVVLNNGYLELHPLTQVCSQTRQEFGTLFTSLLGSKNKQLMIRGGTIRVQDFDFGQSVRVLEQFTICANTQLDINVRVTKQLFRDDWGRLWPWIRYCDEISRHGEGRREHLSSRYSVRAQQLACNPFAASQELYIEIVPYILQGAASGGEKCSGYKQVEKIRAALCNGACL